MYVQSSYGQTYMQPQFQRQTMQTEQQSFGSQIQSMNQNRNMQQTQSMGNNDSGYSLQSLMQNSTGNMATKALLQQNMQGMGGMERMSQSMQGPGMGMGPMGPGMMDESASAEMEEMQSMGRPGPMMGGMPQETEALTEEELTSAEETLTTQTGKELSELSSDEVADLKKELLAQLAVLKDLELADISSEENVEIEADATDTSSDENVVAEAAESTEEETA